MAARGAAEKLLSGHTEITRHCPLSSAGVFATTSTRHADQVAVRRSWLMKTTHEQF
jgi:hypothetical protein